MKLIAGLGNPDKKYADTRHNFGYLAVDAFIRSKSMSWRFNQDWICYFAKNSDCVVIKPATYMNKSGEAVVKVRDFFKIKNDELLVVYDDVDLPFGKIRLAFNGLSAGHHGVDSVIESLGAIEFGRLRIGIGRPENPKVEIADYVLEEFSADQSKEIGTILTKATDAINSYIADGIGATMNRFN